MRIGDVEIQGRAALAPMAGVTDSACRQICQGFGTAYTVTEMVSAKAIQYGDKKSRELADLSHDQGPVFLQIFGDDPQVMASAAQSLLDLGPAGFDINMGCPVPKVAGNGCGSALMKDPQRCGEIVAAVKAAVPVPVTAKMRLGWDQEHKNVVEVARICEQAGADAVCVHGRTRDQMYAGKADWQAIRRVKEALSIPVIANGDVTDAFSAAKLLEETGCDLVMVGRAALGRPWVFRQIERYLADGTLLPDPPLEERMAVLLRHAELAIRYKGEGIAMREIRRHAFAYMKGVRGGADFRRRAGLVSSLEELRTLADELINSTENS